MFVNFVNKYINVLIISILYMVEKDLRYASILEREKGIDPTAVRRSYFNGHGDDFGIYHPLSYYVFGGVDVDGTELRTDAKISYDEVSDIDSGCGVDATCDPRTSYFDIVENLGAELASAVTADAAADAKS